MCGICGTILSGAGYPKELEQSVRGMCSMMTHRGPDEEGIHLSGNVALGHRRLSIIDLSSGQQPLSNEDGSIWVVFNGEIYNYRGIREELLERGHRFTTRSDTEVIVHLYEEIGEELFKKLNGMFAIALWDEKNRRLLLARDRLGKKPLYYCTVEDKFFFASELKAILWNREVPRAVLPESVSNYLSFQYIPPPATIFSGIYKLEPATFLEFSDGKFTKTRYWEPNFGANTQVRLPTALDRFHELLQDAVHIRMESEVPLGAFLSGGVDSSTVVSVMASLSNRPVSTTSIGFKEASFNELPFADEVSNKYSTVHNKYILEPDFIRDLARIIYHLDEPFGDSSALPTYLLCKMTRRSVTVALSGDGGDENFAGYDRYVSGMFEERIRENVPAVFLDLLFRGIKEIASPYVRGYTRIENMTLPLHVAASNTFFCFDDKLKNHLFTETFQRRLRGHSSIDVLEGYFKRTDGLDPLSRLQYVDLVSYLPEDILMKVDRMSMAHSLEVRAPLLDYRIVEFAGTLPEEWKIRNGTGKVFLRQAVKGLIPEKVLNRSKMGFGVPVGDWFRGRLHCLMEAILFDERTIARGYFETAFIRGLWEKHLRGPAWQIDLSHLLWVLIILELWHRLFVDGDTIEDLERWIERAASEKYS